jgi:hypothetical protein
MVSFFIWAHFRRFAPETGLSALMKTQAFSYRFYPIARHKRVGFTRRLAPRRKLVCGGAIALHIRSFCAILSIMKTLAVRGSYGQPLFSCVSSAARTVSGVTENPRFRVNTLRNAPPPPNII